MEKQPTYAQRLIQLVEAHCTGTTADDKVMRTLAAVVFKNLVKTKWAPEVRRLCVHAWSYSRRLYMRPAACSCFDISNCCS